MIHLHAVNYVGGLGPEAELLVREGDWQNEQRKGGLRVRCIMSERLKEAVEFSYSSRISRLLSNYPLTRQRATSL